MREAQEFLWNSQFMQQLQSGWVDGAAEEIAEKVHMLFDHNHRYAGAGEQHPKHHVGGTAAGNAT